MSASGFNEIFGNTLIYPSQLSYLPIALTSDVELDWPVEQNPGGGNIAADIIDVNAALPNLSIQFADATQIGPGYSCLVVNVGANTFSVLDNAGNTLASIASGQAWQLYLRTNLLPAGTWGVFQFGAGVSNANAGALAGAGLQAITTTLNECIPINVQNVPYTIQLSDQASVIEWTGGAGALTGPIAGSGADEVGSEWFCIIKNNGTGTLTFDPGSGTIDGLSSKTFDLQQSAWIVCDGVNFFSLGYGQSVTSIFNFIQISLAGVSGNYPLTGAQLNAVSYRFVGAMAGNTVIVVPSTIQQYWMDNETTGGTLSFATSGQSVPPSLVATQRNIFYCDGTNVYSAVTAGVSFPIAPTNGGTGLISYNLGDIIYASAANTLARLGGNATATKKFLTQTGTGSASTAPSWNTIQPRDLGAGSANNSTFLRGDGTWSNVVTSNFQVGGVLLVLDGASIQSSSPSSPALSIGGVVGNPLAPPAMAISGGGTGGGTGGGAGIEFINYTLTEPELELTAYGVGGLTVGANLNNKPGVTAGASPFQWWAVSLGGNLGLIPVWQY